MLQLGKLSSDLSAFDSRQVPLSVSVSVSLGKLSSPSTCLVCLSTLHLYIGKAVLSGPEDTPAQGSFPPPVS